MANNAGTSCPALTVGSGVHMVSSNSSLLPGTRVDYSCPQFGLRLQGPAFVTCRDNATWTDTTVPSCSWTGTLTTNEKLVLGSAIAGGALIVVLIVAIVIAYCCCYKKRKEEEQSGFDSMYGEDRVSAKRPDDHYRSPVTNGNGLVGGGVYPDAYYAYQEYPEKTHVNGGEAPVATSLDRPWLGYIPRPKVSDGRYYH